MNAHPEIPHLLERMKLKLAKAKELRPTNNFEEQEQIIHLFESLYTDYDYYFNEYSKVYKDNMNMSVIISNLNIRLNETKKELAIKIRIINDKDL